MKILQIIGPYRAPTDEGIEANIATARAAAEDLWRMGYGVICPHLNSARMSGICPEYQFLECYLSTIRRGVCDAVVALPGWQDSSGSQVEMEVAVACGLPWYEWPRDRETLSAGLSPAIPTGAPQDRADGRGRV